MPLESGSSRDVISRNIAELVRSGRDQKQAEAIAFAHARTHADLARVRARAARDGGISRAPLLRSVVGGVTGQQVDGGSYVPPPGPGSALGNRPGVGYDPAAQLIARKHRAAAPDPNTRPMFVPRADAAPRRLPRQIPPKLHESDYAKRVVGIVGRLRAAYAPLLRALPQVLADAEAARRGDRMDAGASDKVKQLLASAVETARRSIQQPELERLARTVAGRVSTYQKAQISHQVRAALGADPVFRDRGLAARVDQFTHENVALISRLPERVHGEVASMVTRAVSGGRRNTDLADDIEDRFDVAETHARMIARDQIGKFYGDLNHARQREMGVNKFIWRTVGDERVRGTPGGKYANAEPSHFDLDGNTYSYDDPPTPPGADGPMLPGEDYQCRCWAEPVFDDDDEGDDSDDDGSDDEGDDSDDDE